jgi:hypothetical protein
MCRGGACWAAEQHLKRSETTPGFGLVLLKAIELPGTPPNLRHAASIFFKNFVKVCVLPLSACAQREPRVLPLLPGAVADDSVRCLA